MVLIWTRSTNPANRDQELLELPFPNLRAVDEDDRLGHSAPYVNAFSPVSSRPMMSFWIWLVPS
jgi:hypothetical protein